MTTSSKSFDPSAASPPDSGLFGLNDTVSDAKVVVVPIPFAPTTSYGSGAENGPQAVLEASKQIDLFDPELGRPYEHGIAMLPINPVWVDWHKEARVLAERVIANGGPGDDRAMKEMACRVDYLSGKVHTRVWDEIRGLLKNGKRVVSVGGDHAQSLGAILAHAEYYPGMGILHVDAHADLRQGFEGFTFSHASIMDNVLREVKGIGKLVQVALRDVCEEEYQRIENSKSTIRAYFDHEIHNRLFDGESWNSIVKQIVSDLPEKVYVSFDIDGLDPAMCPHTGTPVPGGLSFRQAIALIAGVVHSGRTIVGADIMEVVPGADGDQWDGNVGARLLYKLIGWMMKK